MADAGSSRAEEKGNAAATTARKASILMMKREALAEDLEVCILGFLFVGEKENV